MGIPAVGLAVSAVGTVAGINQQSRSARSQRQAIANQELIARDNLTIKTQQLEQAKISNERLFERERSVLDAQTRQAGVQLEQQRVQADLQQMQQQLQIDTVGAQADQQASQLLQSAAAGETEASNVNTQQLFQLAQRFLGSEEQANNFIAQFAAGTGSSALSNTANALLANAGLRDIDEFQGVREDVTTRDRVAGIQADTQRQQSDIIRQQGVLSTDYLSTIQDLQRRANDIGFKQSEFDIGNVSQQNLAGLEAAKFAAQAELDVARSGANLQFRSQQAALDAQRNSVQGPDILGSVINLGAQAFGAFGQPSLLGSSSQSFFGNTSGSSFGGGSSPSFNSSNLSFGTQFSTGL